VKPVCGSTLDSEPRLLQDAPDEPLRGRGHVDHDRLQAGPLGRLEQRPQRQRAGGVEPAQAS
jgi:hypothetical protein